MSAPRRGYALPVQGHPTKITMVRVRADPADVDRYIDNAVTYVDGQLDERWIDCFKMDGDTYDMAVCPCFYPSIVCRAIDDNAPHNGAKSRQTTEIMASFKLKMGISNYAILYANALRKKEEMMAMAQQGQEVVAADHDDAEQVAQGEQEVELQPPPLQRLRYRKLMAQ